MAVLGARVKGSIHYMQRRSFWEEGCSIRVKMSVKYRKKALDICMFKYPHMIEILWKCLIRLLVHASRVAMAAGLEICLLKIFSFV